MLWQCKVLCLELVAQRFKAVVVEIWVAKAWVRVWAAWVWVVRVWAAWAAAGLVRVVVDLVRAAAALVRAAGLVAKVDSAIATMVCK